MLSPNTCPSLISATDDNQDDNGDVYIMNIFVNVLCIIIFSLFLLLLSPNTCPLFCPSLPSATNQDEDYGKDGEDVHGDDGDNAGWICWLHTCILC